MNDTDKILEAEQSIQSIASELKRMRDAANILQGSQKQVDAILKSAIRVTEVTEKFSNECGVIVTKLATTDLTQMLDSLQTLHGELTAVADSIKKEQRSSVGELQDKIQAANNQLITALKTADESTRSDFQQLVTLVMEQANATNKAIANIESKLGTLENQILDGLQMLHGELTAVSDSIKKEQRSSVGELQDKIQAVNDQLITALKTADESTRSDFQQLVTLVKEQANATNKAIANIELKLGTLENQLQINSMSAKKRQIVTIVLTIITFLTASFLLAKALIPSLGG